mmetsp:Transcript_26741/g.61548  ORF Transcript_26741/g.61548 Transcript_26741/m.61548 type:complete len:338 (-) Transcript_26741:18-1031(-)
MLKSGRDQCEKTRAATSSTDRDTISEKKHCYLRISVAGSAPRNVVIQLDVNHCPTTCGNFAALCASPHSVTRPSIAPRISRLTTSTSSDTRPHPTYRGTEFHRILPGFMVQGGDFEHFDGSGGYSADGTTFPDENFRRPHDRAGIVSMANRGRDTNGSQFFITLGRASHLDGKHVAFGEVVEGMEIVRRMADVETEGEGGRPCAMQRIVVVDCGLGRGCEDNEDGKGDVRLKPGDRSEENYRRRKKRDRKERKRSRSRSREKDRRHYRKRERHEKSYKSSKHERRSHRSYSSSRSRSRSRSHSRSPARAKKKHKKAFSRDHHERSRKHKKGTYKNNS